MAQHSLGRVHPTLDEEQALWSGGYGRVAGVDEAGRGAWAGPVVAAAVVLPSDAGVARRLAGVADSKQLIVVGRRPEAWRSIQNPWNRTCRSSIL